MKWYPTAGDKCLSYNAAKWPYEDITCLYPVLKPFYADYELKFDVVYTRDWMMHHPSVPIIAVALYAILIYYGQQYYFKDRKPWNWRTSMALWNLGLSVFSFIGLIRVLPTVIHNFANYSFKENFCNDPESHYGSGTTGMWVLFFILSKFPELFDTFFIVIHKKPLIFLHWYHHISVLAYCWHSYVSKNPVGVIFCVMNYAVHSFMYFYYFLMAVHMKPKFLNPVFITLAQISQMVVGVAVTLVSIYLLFFDKETLAFQGTEHQCHLKKENIIAALIMYGSYLALFLEFFIARYFKKSSSFVPSSKKTKDIAVNGNGSTNGVNGHHANGRTNKATTRRKED